MRSIGLFNCINANHATQSVALWPIGGIIDLQLDIYALGAEKALHLKVANTTAHFLGDGNLVMNAWSNERRAQALTKLTGILNCIDEGKYNPNFSYCAYCLEFREICPYATVV